MHRSKWTNSILHSNAPNHMLTTGLSKWGVDCEEAEFQIALPTIFHVLGEGRKRKLPIKPIDYKDYQGDESTAKRVRALHPKQSFRIDHRWTPIGSSSSLVPPPCDFKRNNVSNENETISGMAEMSFSKVDFHSIFLRTCALPEHGGKETIF